MRVSFTDDEGTPESLTSAATGAVSPWDKGELIWSALLTVEGWEGFGPGAGVFFFGYNSIRGTGSLDPRAFEYDGISTTVSSLRYRQDGTLFFSPDPAFLSHAFTDFNLYLDDARFLFDITATTYEASDHGLSWTDGDEVEVRLTVNRPATGAPVITGTAQVGETLTADVSAIMDEDGIPATDPFSYQWISNDGTDDSDISGATDSTYTLVQADEGKTIKVRVSFTDNANFPETLTSAATGAVAAPTAPIGPGVGTVTSASITRTSAVITVTISNPDTNSRTVNLQYKRNADTAWTGVNPQSTVANPVTFTLSGLTANTDYDVRASLDNAFASGVKTASFKTSPPTTPNAPGNVQASGNAELTVTWDAPTDDGGSAITGYTLQWKSGMQSYNTSRQATVTTTTHTVRVKATNANGDSGWSETTATPASGPGVASVTVVQTSITKTRADVTVTVANLQNAPHAVYLRYRVAGGSWPSAANQIMGTSGAAITFPLTGLTGNTAYDVEASLDSGFASGVKTAAFTTSPTKPGKILTVSVAAGNGQLTATWTAPGSNGGSAITGYKVQWKSGSESFDSSREHTTGASASAYAITGLTNGAEYTVRVIAVNAVGDGPPSDRKTGTPVGPPDAPPNVQAGSGHQQLTVSWGEPNDRGSAITEYTLQWKSGGQGYNSSRQRTIAAPSRTDTIPSLTNGTEYTVRVRAANALGNSDWSAEAKGTPREGPHVSLVTVGDISCAVTGIELEFANLDSATEYTAHLRFRAQSTQSWTVLWPQGFSSSGIPCLAAGGALNGPSPTFTLTDLDYETTLRCRPPWTAASWTAWPPPRSAHRICRRWASCPCRPATPRSA